MIVLDSRFWSKVNKTETCWLWIAGTFDTGYGAFSLNSVPVLAHRLSLSEHLGRELKGQALHVVECPNRNCVNPLHLYEGTPADNVKDMQLVGNNAKGEKHGRRKLTAFEVLEIRESAKTTSLTQEQAASKYCIAQSLYSRIVNRKIWRHI